MEVSLQYFALMLLLCLIKDIDVTFVSSLKGSFEVFQHQMETLNRTIEAQGK